MVSHRLGALLAIVLVLVGAAALYHVATSARKQAPISSAWLERRSVAVPGGSVELLVPRGAAVRNAGPRKPGEPIVLLTTLPKKIAGTSWVVSLLEVADVNPAATARSSRFPKWTWWPPITRTTVSLLQVTRPTFKPKRVYRADYIAMWTATPGRRELPAFAQARQALIDGFRVVSAR